MAKVDLLIGGNSYSVACRDGEEANLMAAAAHVDAKAQQAKRSLGGMNETRQLLFAALLLADELEDNRRTGRGPAAPAPASAPAADPGLEADMLEDIATRLEKLAQRLEQRG